MDIQKIAVIGAGQMGNGIAHSFALYGYDVTMLDISMDAAEKGLATIEKNMARQVDKGIVSQDAMKQALTKITLAVDYHSLSDSDLVIEAATENEELKKSIFKKVCEHIGENTLLATNTSSISITRLAAVTDRADQFIGMHFMNPVPLMKLVEIIRGFATSDETYEAIEKLTRAIEKEPVTANDFPAFIVNRILLPMINEAIFALHEGIGDVHSIDTAMRLGGNHPMGPLQLADLIGLDTCLSIMHVLHDGFADSKYRPSPLLVKYVEAGWLGRKTKRGFYNYTVKPPVPSR